MTGAAPEKRLPVRHHHVARHQNFQETIRYIIYVVGRGGADDCQVYTSAVESPTGRKSVRRRTGSVLVVNAKTRRGIIGGEDVDEICVRLAQLPARSVTGRDLRSFATVFRKR